MEGESKQPAGVLLVDDHPAVREGLALLLAQDGIAVLAEAGGRSELEAALARGSPRIALLDLSLGAESGMDLIDVLVDRGIPVLIYSMHEDGAIIRRTLAAGARGYVTKRELHRVLIEAIREVDAGREYLGPRAAHALAAHLRGIGDGDDAGERSRLRDLSSRERQVYRMLGEGATTSEIAAAMQVSTRTVESYCARLMEKLGLNGMRRLRRDAIHSGHGDG
ncbi:MAG TPA: response regulator transcription factor [Longimicrobiales bacterium]|nr:response regulator transcription factor [Longimicrobiales bacterium]